MTLIHGNEKLFGQEKFNFLVQKFQSKQKRMLWRSLKFFNLASNEIVKFFLNKIVTVFLST